MPNKHLAPRAFTLIELLVVISIIALLIGILLPALGQARAAARNTQCLSRTRQISIAANTYAVENRGFLPAAYGGDNTVPALDGSTDYGKYFTDFLEPYMQIPDDLNSKFYFCPDSTLEPAIGQKLLSYSGNPLLMVNLQTALRRVAFDSVRRPSEVIVLSDSAQNSGAGTSGPTFSGPYMGPFFDPANAETPLAITQTENVDGVPTNGYLYRFRHLADNSGNAAYLDGHAESDQLGTVLQKNLATAY